MIALNFDTDFIDAALARMEKIPYAVQRALWPAVAEVIDMVRVELAERLIEDVPLPARFIRQSIKCGTSRSDGQGVVANLRVASKPLPLIEYDVKPKEVTARKGMRNIHWPGFSYSLSSGERRQREELEGLEHMKGLPFIATMHNNRKGGHLGVYRRTQQGEIKEFYGPRMQYHATTPEIEAYLIQRTEDNFRQILPRIVNQAIAAGGS